nr:uncharacterized protein LOC109183092 [Ipomoea batatas]
MFVVAMGTAYPTTNEITIVHNEPLLPNHVKVMVDEVVRDAEEYLLLVLVLQYKTLGDVAFGHTQWPIHLILLGDIERKNATIPHRPVNNTIDMNTRPQISFFSSIKNLPRNIPRVISGGVYFKFSCAIKLGRFEGTNEFVLRQYDFQKSDKKGLICHGNEVIDHGGRMVLKSGASSLDKQPGVKIVPPLNHHNISAYSNNFGDNAKQRNIKHQYSFPHANIIIQRHCICVDINQDTHNHFIVRQWDINLTKPSIKCSQQEHFQKSDKKGLICYGNKVIDYGGRMVLKCGASRHDKQPGI